ncbi:chalcone isomerase family protein [Shewanella youngdeokensis]|uniref:Chalcone isomerase family protein n=1 Tax=Shewanella youngdeokensis TaxID=2999068 RepID=A0ABZ0K3W3_9GAMM|nr:chalcone isomerase family protein [Shewanella sp. DAU334]
MSYSWVNYTLLLISVLLGSANAAQSAQLDIQPSDKPLNNVDAAAVNTFPSLLESLTEVGRTEMQWWWLTLYRARLLSPNGDYQSTPSLNTYPLILEIKYYQAIPSERLVEATLDQWQHLGLDDERQQNWHAKISSLWPDVAEGDTLSLKVNSEQNSQFYFNGTPLSQSMPAGFSHDFLAIWLSDKTSRPQLREQLLGEIKCDC